MKQGDVFSSQLEAWLKGTGPKTIGHLSQVFSEKSFAIIFLLLMFIPALPIPTGGITHVFEIITMLLALELVIGRKQIWLPQRWKQVKLSGITERKVMPVMVRRIRWLEKFSRPRLSSLLKNRLFLALTGLLVFVFALTAFLAPPFSGLDTLPSMGVVIIALAVILEDAVLLLIGLVVGILGVATTIGLGEALTHLLKHWL